MRLSVVVPCYNEAKNIPLILKRFKEVLSGREDVEIILVNNGSTDESHQVIDEVLPLYPFVKLVNIKVNQGYGYGIIQGLKNSSGRYVGWTHADMQTDPADVIKALNLIEDNVDQLVFVKGDRKGRPLFDRFFTVGMSFFETLYMGIKLNDINAQPNIFPKSFYEEWENPPSDFSLDLYALYMANVKNLKIIRFDVLFPERRYGESKWNTGLGGKWKFIKRTLEFSIKLKRRGVK